MLFKFFKEEDASEPLTYPLTNSTPIEDSEEIVSIGSIVPSTSNSFINEDGLRYNKYFIEEFCTICYEMPVQPNEFKKLLLCKHEICQRCLEHYVTNEINEFRTTLDCPLCTEQMHPSDIEMGLKYDKKKINKYEKYMMRKYLLADPDVRFCPAPDCNYAVIATGCASCPRLHCGNSNCGIFFCFHCKDEWHPDQTCLTAKTIRRRKQKNNNNYQNLNLEKEDSNEGIKACPRCHVMIAKAADGSCNHMICSICNTEFCWLCMNEISELHYLSPSGCTFWGEKPWSRKKKIMWQLGTLIGAPVGIALAAAISIPAMIIGIPIWIGKKIYRKYFAETRLKRNLVVATGVVTSLMISPILAGLAIIIGVPILLVYIYGIVPISLCRTGWRETTSNDQLNNTTITEQNTNLVEIENVVENNTQNFDSRDNMICDNVSRSIGDVSISVGSVSNIGGASDATSNNDKKYDQCSTTGLAGSITADNLSCTSNGDTSDLQNKK